jgi:hypothetical protein
VFAREGECELGTLTIGKRVSGTDFGDRMGVVADSLRNPLSTRSMWRATGADGFARPLLVIAQLGKRVASNAGGLFVKVKPFCASKQQKNAHFH